MGTLEVGLNASCIMKCIQIDGGQGVEYGSLNKNGPHRIIYLHAWSLGNGNTCERLGSMALLE